MKLLPNEPKKQTYKRNGQNRNYPERAGRIPKIKTVNGQRLLAGSYPRGTLTTTNGVLTTLNPNQMFNESVYNTPPDETKPTWEEIEQAKADAADDWQNEQEVTEPIIINLKTTNQWPHFKEFLDPNYLCNIDFLNNDMQYIRRIVTITDVKKGEVHDGKSKKAGQNR